MTSHLDMPQIRSEVVDVTPEMAADWFSRRRSHRPMNGTDVGKLATDMAAGRWMLNGEAIIFSHMNRLLDGRKRLQACMQSKAAFRTLVIYNVNEDAFESIDARRKRRLYDVLTIHGKREARALLTAMRISYSLADGEWRPVQGGKATDSTFLAFLAANPEIEQSTSFVAGLKGRASVAPPGPVAAFHWLFSRIDRAAADAFITHVFDVAAHEPTDPEALLRDRLVAMKGNRTEKMSHQEMAAHFIKAWNARRDGTTLRFLRWRTEGSAPERFPLIHGWEQARRIDMAPRAADETVHDTFGDVSEEIAPSVAGHITAQIVHIIPRTARGLLERNRGNRAMADAVVDKYARDLKAGEWQLNGETIKVASNGRLLDGQHRLAACVKSGVGFQAIVVQNLDEHVFETLDRGDHRDFGDILRDRNIPNANGIASATRLILTWQTNRFVGRFVPSNSEMDRCLDDHPALVTSTMYMHRLRGIIRPSVTIAAEYLIMQNCEKMTGSREMAHAFFEKLASGLGYDSPNDPAYKLREKLIATDDKGNLSVQILALIIRCWGKYLRGDRVMTLKWLRADEAFPELPEPPASPLPVGIAI